MIKRKKERERGGGEVYIHAGEALIQDVYRHILKGKC